MKGKYYYGAEDCEEYYHTDLNSAYEEIRDYYLYGDEKEAIGEIIVEMVGSKKSGIRWCNKDKVFEPECAAYECDNYKPRNGKNGICKHLTWSLIATGRKWVITGSYEYKKISSRRRNL